MNRRGFLSALGALPFVGKLLPAVAADANPVLSPEPNSLAFAHEPDLTEDEAAAQYATHPQRGLSPCGVLVSQVEVALLTADGSEVSYPGYARVTAPLMQDGESGFAVWGAEFPRSRWPGDYSPATLFMRTVDGAEVHMPRGKVRVRLRFPLLIDGPGMIPRLDLDFDLETARKQNAELFRDVDAALLGLS